MRERPHIFGIPKPFPILDTPRPPTPEEQREADERFSKGIEHVIITEELARKRDKAFSYERTR